MTERVHAARKTHLPSHAHCSMEPKSPAAKEAIVNLYEGEAIGSYRGERLYHASLAPAEYERLLVTNAYVVQAHVADDPLCGDHTVWLATYDARITR